MKVLFTMSPGFGHMLPVVSAAWALRTAGHDVLLALAGRSAEELSALAASGLPVVQVGTPEQIREAFDRRNSHPVFKGMSEEQIRATMKEKSRRADSPSGHEFVAAMFGFISEVVVDSLVQLAESWRPDLVVHSPLQGAGPLVAAKLGVPAVEHAYGLSSSREIALAMADAMSDAYQRHGVAGLPERHALLSIAPPSMVLGDVGWPMRHVPYHGGAVLPDWLLTTPERPRITVTLGTVLPSWVGLGPLQWVAEVAAEVDAEFVLALDEADTEVLGALPANVRPVAWTPLSALLATSAAVVHHAGSGSTMAAAAAGLPQLAVPQGADQFVNAHAVAKRGIGFEVDTDVAAVTAADIRRLLTDESLRSAAAEVKAEIDAMPSPAELVSKLVELVG